MAEAGSAGWIRTAGSPGWIRTAGKLAEAGSAASWIETAGKMAEAAGSAGSTLRAQSPGLAGAPQTAALYTAPSQGLSPKSLKVGISRVPGSTGTRIFKVLSDIFYAKFLRFIRKYLHFLC